MKDSLIQVTASLIGTLGFGILFNIRGIKLLVSAFCGAIAWAIFLLLSPILPSEPIRYFIVSVVTTIIAEFLARKFKTPVTTFCIISLISLVPGSALYYTTTAAFGSDFNTFVSKFVYTIKLAVALSLGIVLVIAFFRLISKNKATQPEYTGCSQ